MRHTLAIFTQDERRNWLDDRGAFQALVRLGHCAIKAKRILRQAYSGDRYAIAWTLAAMGIDL